MDKLPKNVIMGVDNEQCQIRREQTDVLAQRGLGNSDLIGRLPVQRENPKGFRAECAARGKRKQ